MSMIGEHQHCLHLGYSRHARMNIAKNVLEKQNSSCVQIAIGTIKN